MFFVFVLCKYILSMFTPQAFHGIKDYLSLYFEVSRFITNIAQTIKVKICI